MSAAIRARLGATDRSLSWTAKYGVAIASVGLALLATMALNRPGIRGTPFIPAIMVSAWYGGIGPGLFAVGLSILTIDYFIVVPPHNLRPVTLDDALYLVVFTVSALFVAWLTGTQRRTKASLQKAHDDLTARIQDLARAEEAMRRSEAYLAESQRLTRTGSWASDVATRRMIHASEELFRLFGFDPEGDIPTFEEFLQRIHPDDRARASELIERSTEERTGVEWVFRAALPDGTLKYIHSVCHPVLDASGNLVEFVGTATDVTERKRAEYLTAQVFEASPDAIAIVERDYRFQRINPVAARIFGVPAETAVGRQVAELVEPGGFEKRLKPALDRCFAGEDVSYASWVGTRGLGRRYVAVSYSPLRPTSDRVEAALAIARDLTEHMTAWEALREAQAELARVTRVTMLGEITASIAHEVNQPLAAVVMNGDACRRWLAADPPNLDEARQAAQRMVKDGERAGQVLARIRSLVRRGTTERSALDMNDVIHEALGFTRAELERQPVAIRTELDADLPAVLGDRVQLQQVLVNLILNARDAMADVSDGPAELTVGSRREASGGVLVEVKDRGRGIDRAQAERIFEAFFSTKPAGLGMGLSVSRSIIEMHGGKIWATSNDGPGATMRFTLPAAVRGG